MAQGNLAATIGEPGARFLLAKQASPGRMWPDHCPAMKKLLTDPLVLFALLGALLAGAYVKLRPPEAGQERIHVSAETIAALVQNDETLRGRRITPEEQELLIESYVDDEVLLREARQAGYDQSDPRVRKRLLSVMRYSVTKSVPEASRQQLETYYNENREDYTSAPSVDLEHVFFPWNSAKLPADPKVFLKTLEQSADPLSLGEPFDTTNRVRRASRRDLLGLFGPTFTDAVEDIGGSGSWYGPIESNRGTHYLRVTARNAPVVTPFEDLESYLQQDWQFRKVREGQKEEITAMRENYQIVIDEE